jgi:tetratricopeptide (TPR) repeat protein
VIGKRRHLRDSLTHAIAVAWCALICGAAYGSSIADANNAYAAGNFPKAAKLYRAAAREGESPALCYYNAANAYFQIDSLAQAVVFYRACAQNAPGFLKAHLNLAVSYYALNDLGRCIASADRVLRLAPGHQKALAIKAAALRGCGATAKTVVAYEELARRYPQLEEPYIALGEIYRDLDDPDESIKWLEATPLGGKNGLYVCASLADLYEKKNDLSRSLFYLKSAYDIDKTKRSLLYRIAKLQQQAGSPLVAIETCKSGLDRFPDFADLAVLAGTIAFDRSNMNDAEKFFSQGARLGSPSAVVGLSNVRNWRRVHEEER